MDNSMSLSWQVILTSAVIGAVVTSIANIIISILNNNHLKNLENKRISNEITTYRYTKLYEFTINWEKMNAPFETENRSPSEIAAERLINGFIDDYEKYGIVSPLLDEKYKLELDELGEKGNQCLKKLIEIENELEAKQSQELQEQHNIVYLEYIDLSVRFSTTLRNIIQKQLEELMNL